MMTLFGCFCFVFDNLGQAVVAIVWPFQAHLLLHALVVDALGPAALVKLHVARALLHAVDVAHELSRAGGFHFAEELHGAAGHLLASSKASPWKDRT